ncbi:hypothetical protein N780_15735 [Pontibacillus chungwhensis BH030062]|uniref:Uncharacterized protein n=1 Tax=Pontibacillus chungwhensis BH030062 TaxID=1385513 RepID=A0A0A2UUM5_9BACI|nr:hypothetical protein [Pontibacillus chungwhensis]KGP91997.1 hypothetical protein N780_15735 [Pontibacillus chungwhensis BH030062]
MKLIKILLLFSIIGSLVASNNGEYYTFENKDEAEQEIGDFHTPSMPKKYIIKKITYDNDGFTHPITKVFYQKGSHKITFMIGSSWFDNSPKQKVDTDKINDIVWISKEKEYVLKWRNSDKKSYKYLFTRDEGDKVWLISIAENY